MYVECETCGTKIYVMGNAIHICNSCYEWSKVSKIVRKEIESLVPDYFTTNGVMDKE